MQFDLGRRRRAPCSRQAAVNYRLAPACSVRSQGPRTPCESYVASSTFNPRNMIFTNARLIFPDGIRDGLEVVVEEGKIAALRPAAQRLWQTSERVHGEKVV